MIITCALTVFGAFGQEIINWFELETPPEPIKEVTPEYPELARRGEVEGRILVQVTIGIDGKVEKAEIIKADPEGFFEEATLEAAYQWEFTSATKDGEPIRVLYQIPFNFKLESNEEVIREVISIPEEAITREIDNDNSDSLNVRLVGYIATAAQSVYVSGSYAYVTGAEDVLRIIDVSSPSFLSIKGSISPGPESYAFDVQVYGSYAYMGADDGLHIIDISVPSSPSEIGFYDTPDYANGVYVFGNYAYIAGGDSIYIVDITTPTSPTRISSFNMPVAIGPYFGLMGFEKVFVQGDYAYIPIGGGFHIIDVSSPSSPHEVGKYYIGGCAEDIFVRDSFAYIADDWDGFHIFDISDPSAPSEVSSYRPEGDCSDGAASLTNVYVEGDYAFITQRYRGWLYILDISSPSTLRVLTHVNIPMHATDIIISGSYAYVTAEAGLFIYDVSQFTGE